MTYRAASGRSDGEVALRVVVIGDSTAFTDHRGPQLPDEPTLYPNVLATHLGERLGRPIDCTVLAQPGSTVRDAVRLVTKDRHAQFEVIGPADAVVVGVGSFDHAPAGVPPSLQALVPFLRPASVRRTVRSRLHAAYPRLVRIRRGRGRRTPAGEFHRLYGQLLDHVRGLTWGRAAGVALGPTSHRSTYYGDRHPEHPKAEAEQLSLAVAHGFRAVAAWPLIRPHTGSLNPDGIHWPAPAHRAVGLALAEALAPSLRGDGARIGLPEDRG